MRRCEPGGEQRRIFAFGLVESLELPGAVIDVAEIVANFRRCAAGLGDGGAGLDAAAHRARIDLARLPGAGDAPGHGLRLGTPEFSQIERRPAAKPFRLDAFDVAVADQQDFGHVLVVLLSRLCRVSARAAMPRVCYRRRSGMDQASQVATVVNSAMVRKAERNASAISDWMMACRAAGSAAMASGP